MSTTPTQKQLAIDQHSRQADQFSDRYQAQARDPYRDCFAYSRRRLDACLEGLLSARGEGRRLLDVGCGTGHHVAALRRQGYDAAGVDASPEMLEHARAVNPEADVRLADVDALPYPDESFDFVLCVEVLRYLPRPADCIREMARVLKPGGVCLATAAPLLSLNAYPLVNLAARLLPVGRLTRLRQYFTTSARLRRQFREVGLAPARVYGVYAGPINWVERTVPRVLPRLLKWWEPVDRRVADAPLVREFGNMFLVHATKGDARVTAAGSERGGS